MLSITSFREVLYQIEQCETEHFEIDPIQLAKVFIEKVCQLNKLCKEYRNQLKVLLVH